MNRNDSVSPMRLRSQTALSVATLVIAGLVVPFVVVAQAGNVTNSPVSLVMVKMESVPLSDAIMNLARQEELNYILDPRLPLKSLRLDGTVIREPEITVCWTNITAREALKRLLDEHKLFLVESAETTIARITQTNKTPRVSSFQSIGSDMNEVIPLIAMDAVPLDDAIQEMAKRAKVKVEFDLQLSKLLFKPNNPINQQTSVSIRWKNVTAKQALAALLDNYDLLAMTNVATGVTRIKLNQTQR
jgi:hypothetical protein